MPPYNRYLTYVGCLIIKCWSLCNWAYHTLLTPRTHPFVEAPRLVEAVAVMNPSALPISPSTFTNRTSEGPVIPSTI